MTVSQCTEPVAIIPMERIRVAKHRAGPILDRLNAALDCGEIDEETWHREIVQAISGVSFQLATKLLRKLEAYATSIPTVISSPILSGDS